MVQPLDSFSAPRAMGELIECTAVYPARLLDGLRHEKLMESGAGGRDLCFILQPGLLAHWHWP